MSFEGAIAMNRFGLGARPGDVVTGAPKRWLHDQIAAFDPRPAALAEMPDSATMAARFQAYQRQIRDARDAAPPPAAGAPVPPAEKSPRMAMRQAMRQDLQRAYRQQVGARVAAAIITPTPFPERLVHFWANHFAVSADKLPAIGLAGTLEFEAIRPHLTGRFADLLVAVERHPAMLVYLDQAQSTGPGSLAGSRAAARPGATRKVGLNENLAREILELHTLGVGAGYTQADVEELARGLTGWTIAGGPRRPGGGQAPDGTSIFAANRHEPGERTLLGVRYAAGGAEQAEAMLRALAVHPATARHLAVKLARHFVADVPPPALVDRLAAVHLATGGDLAAVYEALVDAPEAWAAPLAKFKTPWEWTVSSLRATGATVVSGDRIAPALTQLGQPAWRPGSPAGWDDSAASWAAPDALLRRVEAAQRLVAGAAGRLDARALGPALLPGVWSASSAAAVAKAGTPAMALALLLVTPEFLRR